MKHRNARVITVRRSTVVRGGIVAVILVAFGIGIAIGLTVTYLQRGTTRSSLQPAPSHRLPPSLATTVVVAPKTKAATTVAPTALSCGPGSTPRGAAYTYRHRLCQRRHIGHGRDVVIVGERRGVWEWHPERQQLPTHLCHRKCHQLPGLRRRLGPRGGRVPGRARDATQWDLDSAVELSTRFGLGSGVNVTHTPLRSSMKAL